MSALRDFDQLQIQPTTDQKFLEKLYVYIWHMAAFSLVKIPEAI